MKFKIYIMNLISSLIILAFSVYAYGQNNVPQNGDVSMHASIPQTALHFNRVQTYNKPIVRLEYPLDKSNYSRKL